MAEMHDPEVLVNSFSSPGAEVAELLSKKQDRGLVFEFWSFFCKSGKWWLLPLLLLFLLIGAFLGLAQTGMAPFIYVLF